jgi:uncharacterized membrane protein
MAESNPRAYAGGTAPTTDELLLLVIDRLAAIEQRLSQAESTIAISPKSGDVFDVIASPPTTAADFEHRFASSFLNYFGLVVLLAGLGLLIGYSFNSHSTATVLLTCIGAAALWLLARLMRRGTSQSFSLTLEGTALGLLYLACYLSYEWWGMLPSLAAGIVVMLLAIRRAASLDSQLVALFALAAAFTGPLFLRSVHSGESLLFGYLAVLNAAVVWTGRQRGWTGVRFLALLGSHGLAGFWYATHPGAEIVLTASFPALTFLLFALVTPDDGLPVREAMLAVINSLGLLAAAISLLRTHAPGLVVFAPVALGVIHVVVGTALFAFSTAHADGARRTQARVHVWIAGLLIAAGAAFWLPLPLIAIAWTAEAFLVGWWGTQHACRAARNAANLLALAAAGAVVFSLGSPGAESPHGIVTAAALLFSLSVVARHYLLNGRPSSIGNWEWMTHWMLAIFSAVLPMLALSRHVPDATGASHLFAPSLSTALLWSAYSMAVCMIGWFRISPFLRWTGVALLLLTSVRVFLVETVALSTPARIASFLLLAVFLLVLSYLFQSRQR